MEYRPAGLSEEIVGAAERIQHRLFRERPVRRNVDVDHPVAGLHRCVAADKGRPLIGDKMKFQSAETEDFPCKEIVDPAELAQSPVSVVFKACYAPYLDVAHRIDVNLV